MDHEGGLLRIKNGLAQRNTLLFCLRRNQGMLVGLVEGEEHIPLFHKPQTLSLSFLYYPMRNSQ